MEIDIKIRGSVVESLPEAKKILNTDLRDKVYDAWTMSLQINGFSKIEEMEHSGTPGVFASTGRTQADHLRGVARLAMKMAEELKDMFQEFRIDMDEVIAGGLCHDIGKPFEYNKANRERWAKDPSNSGSPAIRHSVYGVHIALSAGLPEKIAHIAGAHSREGQFIDRSLVGELIHFADEAYWHVLAKAGIVK